MKNKYLLIPFIPAIMFAVGCNNQSNNQDPTVVETDGQSVAINVIDWGPKESLVNTPFNLQANGTYGIWFKVSGFDAEKGISVLFGDKKLEGYFVDASTVTTSIDPLLISKPGTVAVKIVENITERQIQVGFFTVFAK